MLALARRSRPGLNVWPAFVDVMTNGFGAMPDHAAQVAPADRWAIAAYIRALQLSSYATLNDVPAEDRQKLESSR